MPNVPYYPSSNVPSLPITWELANYYLEACHSPNFPSQESQIMLLPGCSINLCAMPVFRLDQFMCHTSVLP